MAQAVLERSAAPVKEGRRDPGLDLIRTVAGFLVISVHFFLHTGFYAQPMEGGRMLLMATLRMAFMTCVPLFLLLTGFLCRKKELTKRYYLGIVRVLLTYALCGLACQLFRLWRGEALSLREGLRQLLDFSAAPYGWYVKMYVGLFLLIPFVNLAWKGLETKGRRLALAATLLSLTALPALAGINDWWVNVYPLAYYILGAWLGEYEPRPKARWLLLGLAGTVALGGAAAYKLNQGGVFQWRHLTDWYGPTVMASSCILFLLLRQAPTGRAPGWVKWLAAKGAQLSLGIYLLSWIFDQLYYPTLLARAPDVTLRLPWYFVMVPAVYFSSALAAQGVEWIRMGIVRGVGRIFPQAGLK